MSIRVGVDVGGTFTKAIAFDTNAGAVVAQAVVPTTHEHVDGVAAGVVQVVTALATQVGAHRIDLVTHSTTQAVNALLEGDVACVGMIGMSTAGERRKARKRTVDVRIHLAAGRTLPLVSEFLDVATLDEASAGAAVDRLIAAGAQAIAVAEAFAPDDTTNEAMVAAQALARGLPATTSAELTGLYGLELRAVTAAINASVIPIALRTAEVVDAGVAAAGISGQVMVMRGDGGATDLAGFRQAPARTLYSGPAASVAGALRSTRIADAVIVEVGGTSSNVAAVRRGRPALSYVQVASHATALRAIDVRVLGVAGGSLLRAKVGRRKDVLGVGPRSAHIAGLPYTCFLTPAELDGAAAELIAPRPGDPADYLVLRLADGRRAALTNTCAANALQVVEPGDYAAGSVEAAVAGFAAAGRFLALPGAEVARRMLRASTDALCELVTRVSTAHELHAPVLVAVGGGAGGLGRAVARAMGLELVLPPSAEVISAVGDALSLIRAERERTFAVDDPGALAALVAEVEDEAVRAGAGASSLDVRVEYLAERGAVRVTATGSVALLSGAIPGRPPADQTEAAAVALDKGYPQTRQVGQFWVCHGGPEANRMAVLDQFADLIVDVRGDLLPASAVHAPEPGAGVGDVFARGIKRMGPVTITPDVWLISGSRLLQVPVSDPAQVAPTVLALCPPGADFTVIVGRE